MKNFKKIFAVVFMGCTLSASAQFTGGNTKSVGSSVVADTDSYNRFSLSYDNTSLSANKHLKKYFNGEDKMGINGFGLEYTHGFSVSRTLPMFVEAGIKFNMGFGSVSDGDEYNGYKYDEIMKVQDFSFIVPINYTYRIPIGEGMNIAPYIGINLKLHAMSRMKFDMKFEDDDLQEEWDDEYEDESKWKNVFDKDDMGNKDYTWNRFQMGWQVGVGFSVKKFYIGLQYGTDFIHAFNYKKETISSGCFTAKIGINF